MAEIYRYPGSQFPTFPAPQPERLCPMGLEKPSQSILQDATCPPSAANLETTWSAGVGYQSLLNGKELDRLIWIGELCRMIDREVSRRVVATTKEIKKKGNMSKVQERAIREEQLDKYLKELGLSRSDYQELKETQVRRNKAAHPTLVLDRAVEEWKQLRNADTKQISQ
ncbi:hypothetical protein EC968_010588 [Mortierella alpina]|nr:hypothetical protein EC968_010588 [Mortierella alpina]